MQVRGFVLHARSDSAYSLIIEGTLGWHRYSLAMRPFTSLRSRIIALVALAVLPGVILTVFVALEQRDRAYKQVEATNLTYLRLAGLSISQVVRNARDVMTSLSLTSQIRSRDADGCRELLERFIESSQEFRGATILDRDGRAWCYYIRGGLVAPSTDGRQTPAFLQAMERKSLVVAGLTMGNVSKRPNLNFGLPVLDANGEIDMVITIALDADTLNDRIEALKLPDNYVVNVIDKQGIAVVRWPRPESFVGKSVLDAPITQRMLNEGRDGGEHTARTEEIEGTQRLFAFSSVAGAPANDLFVNIGIAPEAAFAPIDSALARNLVALAVCAIAAIAGGWLLSSLFITRRVAALSGAARRLSTGDLTARTGATHTESELGQLARTFDTMAERLQQREHERDVAVADLQRIAWSQGILGDVSAASVRSLNYADSLQDIAAAICNSFGNMCVIGVAQPDGVIKTMASCHRDVEKLKLFGEMARDYFGDLDIKTAGDFVGWLRSGDAMVDASVQGIFGRVGLGKLDTTMEEQWRGFRTGPVLAMPLTQRGRVLGLLTIIREEGEPAFSPDEIELAKAFAARVSAALDSMRLYQEVQKTNASLEQQVTTRTQQLQISNTRLLDSQQELRNLSNRQNEMIEEERRRIAREVHDQIGQALTSIKMDLSAAQRRLDLANAVVNTPVIDKIKSASQLVDDTIQIARRISADLRPGILDDLGLEAAVEWQLREFEKHSGVKCKLDSAVEDLVLGDELPITTFRILQEALTNVARHADATEVRVTLETSETELLMRVQDNGVGLNEDVQKRRSTGMLGMRERALQLNGSLEVNGAQRRGTTLTLKIPLTTPEEKTRDEKRDAARDVVRDSARDMVRDAARDEARDMAFDGDRDAADAADAAPGDDTNNANIDRR